jgi:hypothetical protein
VSNIAQDTQQPHWQFIRQASDKSTAPPAPADEALWLGHGCLACYVDGEHVLWSANATAVMLAWAAACAAHRSVRRWEALDAADFARLAAVEAHRHIADARYVARMVSQAAFAATNGPLTRTDWEAWGLDEVVRGARKAGKSACEIADEIQHIRVQRKRLDRERQNETLTAALIGLDPCGER